MDTTANKKSRFNFFIWLGDLLMRFLKGLKDWSLTIIKWAIILGIIGSILWFGGRKIKDLWETHKANTAKMNAWVDKHMTYKVGELMILGGKEKGTEFYKILESTSKTHTIDELIFIIQSATDKGVYKAKIKANKCVVVDTLIQTPFAKLVSRDYGERVYEKDEPNNDLSYYLINSFNSSSLESFNKLYIYINKRDTEKYIILDD